MRPETVKGIVDCEAVPFLGSGDRSGDNSLADPLIECSHRSAASKLGFMLPFTNEMADYAIEDGFTLFSRMLTETAKSTLDKAALLYSVAGSSNSQPGLLHSVTSLAPTTGGGLAAFVGDLKKLPGAMASAGVTSDGAVIVAHAEQAEVLNTLPPQPLKHDVFGAIAVPVGSSSCFSLKV